jgi:hypothetical protein
MQVWKAPKRDRHMDLPNPRQETKTNLRQACDEQQAKKNYEVSSKHSATGRGMGIQSNQNYEAHQ